MGQKKPGNWAGLETHKCAPRREVTREVQNTSLDCRRLWRRIPITMHHRHNNGDRRRLEIIRATATNRDQLDLLSSEAIAKASALVLSA